MQSLVMLALASFNAIAAVNASGVMFLSVLSAFGGVRCKFLAALFSLPGVFAGGVRVVHGVRAA